MYGEIMDNLDFEPRSIIRTIETRFQYTISYAKAWRAKQKALESRFGTFDDSYRNLPRLLQVIQDMNPGTHVAIKDSMHPKWADKRVLERAFFSFGPCINVFRYCRPILCVDDTFLARKYNGQILTAIATDRNNQVLPVAFAFVESENTNNWLWFLKNLRLSVVQSRPNVCTIHDRHAGLDED